ncbi:MAG TPA: isopeptide-forming domain-containing fimbrial protein, partial [Pyrinomonadaceae bacterium]|nr:isopeptide-forming domain-containing fimbrial protein [Pyrinomonadaceae bacterium]
MSRVLPRIAAAAILAAFAIAWAAGGAAARAIEGDGGTAGVVISNRAEATYDDADGATFSTVSPTVSVTIKSVSSLKVTPDESAPSASVGPRETVTRVFRVCNLGNTPDLYTITRAEVNDPARITRLYFDVDASGTVTSADTVVNVGTSLSPRVAAGLCLNVLVLLETNDVPAHSSLTIRLGARSNVVGAVNGRGEDEGAIINAVGEGPRVTSPDDSSLPPTKLVNDNPQAIVSPGLQFTYTIRFRNSGDVTARDVVVSDDLPAEISYVADSLRLEERALTDAEDADEGSLRNGNRRLEVRLSEVAPDQVVRISFKARLTGNAPAGVGVINGAVVTGQNLVPTQSTTAVVVIDPFGVVFSGRGGAASPIANASVAILLDQSGASPLQIPAGLGFAPNTENVNPYPSDGQGHFSFALRPDQLGTPDTAARYFMKVTASGYITRMLELSMRPNAFGLFQMSVRALDGQPLARPDGHGAGDGLD